MLEVHGLSFVSHPFVRSFDKPLLRACHAQRTAMAILCGGG